MNWKQFWFWVTVTVAVFCFLFVLMFIVQTDLHHGSVDGWRMLALSGGEIQVLSYFFFLPLGFVCALLSLFLRDDL
jgi:hypothetical protein